MSASPHSRAWYARLAAELGGYHHPWQRVLEGPDPEQMFDLLLRNVLRPESQVLDAGCGHGPDAARFGTGVRRWAAYDQVPELLDLARMNAPHATFQEWNGRGEVPAPLRGPFDVVVSRRGPTSVIPRLPELAAPDARFLYVGPRLHVPQVEERLLAVGWCVLAEWHVSVQAYAPTWEDWSIRGEWMEEPVSRREWEARVTARGMPYREERHVVLAKATQP
ncbi:class I SAM-dependent methyltransferase [Deinococcus sonorensis]|uniref:Methyltransferase domain-containing protein n=2 Tax=Deinococcus sonorensis TaxID=309891 RepID=A0AAU7UCM8_9DEIO